MVEKQPSGPLWRTRNRHSRGRGLRKTTGCITCRKRHVKCDEGKPTCNRCLKIGNQPCIYGYAKEVIHEPQRQPTTATTGQQCSPGPSIELEQPISETNSRPPPQDDRNPLLGASSHNEYIMSNHTDSPNQQIMSPERMSGACSIGSNHSLSQGPASNVALSKWFDMLVGDATVNGFGVNSQDYDGLSSTQGDQDDLVPNIAAPRDCLADLGEQRTLPTSSSPQLLERNPPAIDVASERLRWQATGTIELLPREKPIWENFVKRLSHWIDLFDVSQNFSTFVPHLAMQNTGLIKAILALSTRHLSQLPGVMREGGLDRNDALQYYNETLHYISKAMQYNSYKTSLELLATVLIVSAYEMIDGSARKDWERHLQGVFWIQRSQVIHGDSGGLRQAVWWAWLCQDVWAAFREKRKTFTFWKPLRGYDSLSPHELAARSIYLMALVVSYCSREESDDPLMDITTRINRADRLSSMLDDWKGYLTTEFTPLPCDRQVPTSVFRPIWIHPPAFGVSLQIHYSARLLLLVNSPSRGGLGSYLERSRLIAGHVASICGIAMTLTDHASSVMSSQCLFIAGMFIQDIQQRQAVLTLIDSCRQRTGWPASSLGEELQAFWDAPADS